MKRLGISFLLAVALLAGLARAAVAPEPITHDATEKKSFVTVRVTGTLKIVLPVKSEPGHQWQIISNDPRILKPLGDVKPAAGAKAAAEDAAWEITFVAQRPGRSIVRFIYTQPGDSAVAAADSMREVTVRVQ